MTLEMFYQKLLNPPKPWVVSKVELSEDGSRVDVVAYFKKWFWRATHSRLEPIRKAAKTLKRHWAGILAAIMNGISNSATEGLNSKIEVIKRSACGYRNKDNFRTAILFYCGKLDLMPEQER